MWGNFCYKYNLQVTQNKKGKKYFIGSLMKSVNENLRNNMSYNQRKKM